MAAPGEAITIRAPPPCRRTREELARAICSAEERPFSLSTHRTSMQCATRKENGNKIECFERRLNLLGMERTAACCGSLLSAPTSNVRISRLLVSFGVSHQRSFVQIFPFLFCRVDIGKSIHLCQPKSSAALLTATATRVPPLVGTPIRTSL